VRPIEQKLPLRAYRIGLSSVLRPVQHSIGYMGDGRAYRKSYYEKSSGTKMNDLGRCLEVVRCHVNHCVTFSVEYLGNR